MEKELLVFASHGTFQSTSLEREGHIDPIGRVRNGAHHQETDLNGKDFDQLSSIASFQRCRNEEWMEMSTRLAYVVQRQSTDQSHQQGRKKAVEHQNEEGKEEMVTSIVHRARRAQWIGQIELERVVIEDEQMAVSEQTHGHGHADESTRHSCRAKSLACQCG